MREIGVRDLKRSLSETLRAVERGEQVRVTVRGRPVADIVPAGAAASDDRVRALVAEGRMTPPAAARPPRAPRLAKVRGSASGLVIAERDAER
jgi:prevent-host-death family protein